MANTESYEEPLFAQTNLLELVNTLPIRQDIVLIGGGHSHVEVLKSFGMKPVPGVRLTVVSRDIEAPYSGMLPGLMAGHYRHAEAHIDLQPLARFAKARLFHASATGIDLQRGVVLTDSRPPLPYDYLSLNVGSTPLAASIRIASGNPLPVKPVDAFLRGWNAIETRLEQLSRAARIAIVGAGAGGVELCLSLHHRLHHRSPCVKPPHFIVITQSSDVALTHAARVRSHLRNTLLLRDIEIRINTPVIEINKAHLTLGNGDELEVDETILVTGAQAPHWLAESGLALDEQGFVRIGPTLQSISHPRVFASGDVAAFDPLPLPKSGVFAVRQGPLLSENLRRLSIHRSPLPYRPQKRTLALISTGDKAAIISYGPLAFQGQWIWRWKDWIDRRWMRKYQDLPLMEANSVPEHSATPSAFAMRCGGCGSKVSSAVLKRVLNKLPKVNRDGVVLGFEGGDDAAVLRVPPNQVLVQSVDHFRPFIDDAYLFGQITANHCLSDLYAMGASPHSAQAMVTVAVGLESKVESDLFYLLAGTLDTLRTANVALVGGHTAEGSEMILGLTVNGFAEEEQLLSKGRLCVGDQLILTKPLGTGVIFAADMYARSSGGAIKAAVQSMLISNQRGAQTLGEFEVKACTDITGFGVLGHLVEMLNSSAKAAILDVSALPLLPFTSELLAQGILSSLDPANRAFASQLDIESITDPRLSILFDPQTSGGLLGAVKRDLANACINTLRQVGYPDATIIGEVIEGIPGQVHARLSP